MTSARRSCLWQLFVVVLGCFLFILGVFLYINWIEMFTQLRGREMALTPTSRSYPGWKSSPLPLNFDIYLFNWTNPKDFYEGSNIKPHFIELGPYRFREVPDKTDIEWHPENASISFRKTALFYFDAEGSKGQLTDKITTVNVVAHAAAKRSENGSYFSKKLVENTLRVYNEGVSITKTADELLFTGYLDPLVTLGKIISKIIPHDKIISDRIGWMYGRNGSKTFDGHINMHTGEDDIYKLGQIHTWNHMTNNHVYEGECGDVKGSMGEFFPPNLSTNDSISIYLPNMCRSVPLDYSETVRIHGVTAFKFSGMERSIDNGTLFPEAKCFCVKNKCELSGVINTGPCQQNSSSFMSYPHFYKADPYYLKAVDGLKPDKAKHEFYITLEPNAGVVMDVGGGFQFNFLTEPVDGISPFDKVPRKFMPIMWCEERVRVTSEIAADIALVPLIVLLGQVVTGALLGSGVLLMWWYPAKTASKFFHDPKTKNKVLSPLSSARIVPSTPIFRKPADDYPLLDMTNGSYVRPNGTVTESLLGNTLRPPLDVIIR